MTRSPAVTRGFAWTLRLLLAALLFFSSEILFWLNPLQRPLWEWLPLIVGYGLVAVVLLDLSIRYRVRDLWGVMVVIGVYGLLNAAFINPDTALADVPNTLLSHALGGHWLFGLYAWGGFMALLTARHRAWRLWLLIGAAQVGVIWGIWVAHLPVYNPNDYAPVTPAQMMLAVGLPAVAVLALWIAARRLAPNAKPDEDALLIDLRGYVISGLIGFGLLVYQGLRSAYVQLNDLVWVVALFGIFWALLWFRGDKRQPGSGGLLGLLSEGLPSVPLHPVWPLLALILFSGGAILGYALPLIPLPLNQFTLLTVAFSLLGAVWVPLVGVLIGLKALQRQMQTQPL